MLYIGNIRLKIELNKKKELDNIINKDNKIKKDSLNANKIINNVENNYRSLR